jgi:hypothetical protein
MIYNLGNKFTVSELISELQYLHQELNNITDVKLYDLPSELINHQLLDFIISNEDMIHISEVNTESYITPPENVKKTFMTVLYCENDKQRLFRADAASFDFSEKFSEIIAHDKDFLAFKNFHNASFKAIKKDDDEDDKLNDFQEFIGKNEYDLKCSGRYFIIKNESFNEIRKSKYRISKIVKYINPIGARRVQLSLFRIDEEGDLNDSMQNFLK